MIDNPFAVLDRRINRLESLLEEILKNVSNSNTPIDEVGGMEVATQVTRLSEARIYTLVSKRLIPHKKRGNRLTFRRTELLEWLEQGDREQKRGLEV